MRVMFLAILLFFLVACAPVNTVNKEIKLPLPFFESDLSVEKAILERRSIREYSQEPLTVNELSQLLWAAQGVTSADGRRTAPSAGALYPLELYVAVANVSNLEQGVYHYNPDKHSITKVLDGDLRSKLYPAAVFQSQVKDAPIILVFTAVYQRTTKKYGTKGNMFVHIEVGHAAQNVYLQSESLGLGTVDVGGFSATLVKALLKIDEEPILLMPVGKTL